MAARCAMLDVTQNSAQDAFQPITRPHQLCWGDWEMETAIWLSRRKRVVCQLGRSAAVCRLSCSSGRCCLPAVASGRCCLPAVVHWQTYQVTPLSRVGPVFSTTDPLTRCVKKPAFKDKPLAALFHCLQYLQATK